MKITFLGCGTSTGVPIIGCRCATCSSVHPRNKRLRSSILVQTEGKNILIDTSTDLRTQSLAYGLTRIDAVLYTHAHADHVNGIDDLRAFNLAQKTSIPCFGNRLAVERIRTAFDYIFKETPEGGWKPDLTTTVVTGPFTAAGVDVTPVEIRHGTAVILGFRLGRAAYLTDCSAVPPGSIELLAGLDLLILGALRQKPHPTHFCVSEAIEASKSIGAKRTVLTHMGHSLDYTADNGLPEGVELAYDGLGIEV